MSDITAVRQMRKYRFHSFLNIFGLGLSIACFLFIYIFNSYQLSFDRFHPHADRTFLVVQEQELSQTEKAAKANPVDSLRDE